MIVRSIPAARGGYWAIREDGAKVPCRDLDELARELVAARERGGIVVGKARTSFTRQRDLIPDEVAELIGAATERAQ